MGVHYVNGVATEGAYDEQMPFVGTKRQRNFLDETHKRDGISRAEILRRALNLYIETHERESGAA